MGLDRIQRLVDLGRLNPTKPIDLRALKLAGVNFSKDGVRITGRVRDAHIILLYSVIVN